MTEAPSKLIRRNNPKSSKPGRKAARATAAPFQDPHAVGASRGNVLLESIGREVRRHREKLNMTIKELAKSAALSAGMLSKVENGSTAPSLYTIQALARALQVPVTALFKSYEEVRTATYVKAGHGLTIERQGTRAGHQYRLLGHTPSGPLVVEPYLLTLTEESDVFPIFQHAGIEFIYMLEGEVLYRHADKTYPLRPGDALYFDADAPHGPEELRKLPARYISVICYTRND